MNRQCSRRLASAGSSHGASAAAGITMHSAATQFAARIATSIVHDHGAPNSTGLAAMNELSCAPSSSRKRRSSLTRYAAAKSGRCWQRASFPRDLDVRAASQDGRHRETCTSGQRWPDLKSRCQSMLAPRPRSGRSRVARNGGRGSARPLRAVARDRRRRDGRAALPGRDRRQRRQRALAQRHIRPAVAERAREVGGSDAQRTHPESHTAKRSPHMHSDEGNDRGGAAARTQPPPRRQTFAKAPHGVGRWRADVPARLHAPAPKAHPPRRRQQHVGVHDTGRR